MDDVKPTERVTCPMESVSTTFQSLDTVRALHQTVVSLRSALEEAKTEIHRLRSQITVQSDIKEGTKRREVIDEPTSKVTPTITDTSANNVIETIIEKKEVSTAPVDSEIKSGIPINIHTKTRLTETIVETDRSERKSSRRLERSPQISIVPDISIVRHPTSDDNRMASKIDVKIKLMSNIKVDGKSIESTSSDSQQNSSRSDKSEKMPTSPKLQKDVDEKRSTKPRPDVSIKKLSVTLKPSKQDFDTVEPSNDNIIDDELDNSASEGDNSVFQDDIPLEEEGATAVEPKTGDGKTSDKEHEGKEEVDDIELIFSSDETRDPIQEDLVSISEYDPWQAPGSSGTPVLVKFASIQTDQESSTQGTPPGKKLPTSTSHEVFFTSDSSSVTQQKSLESTDSLDHQRSPKSSSLDKEYSTDQKDEMQLIGRDESVDFFDNREFSAMGRKWTNCNVLVETDISKCGIIEETTFEMYRRNTCPNPPAYRPVMHHRDTVTTGRHIAPRLSSRYSRRISHNQHMGGQNITSKTIASDKGGPKRSSSAQTDISALPEHWKSESQLARDRYHLGGPCTLPSKFVPTIMTGQKKHSMRISNRTQEARRVLLSDINFTSMVPELSRSADHLCQDEENQEQNNKQSSRYYKGNLLKTPDYALKGITPSVSMTSPGVSQWTVNENSFGTQTIQTGELWGKRGDSFDSCRSYSMGSRYSSLDRHHRSRSVPSIRCAVCKQAHNGQGIRTSESMNYTPRVTFQEPSRIRGSLPDLRNECVCCRRYGGRSVFTILGDSSGSTESLLDEADMFVRKSMDSTILVDDIGPNAPKRVNLRRMSENDIQRDYIPSKQSLPFLPKTAKCLKPGHLAKVISKNGRVVVGRVRYVGPLATVDKNGRKTADDLYVGVQLQSKCGDSDGTFEGRKFFDCEPLHGLFVPFKKVVMAWTG